MWLIGLGVKVSWLPLCSFLVDFLWEKQSLCCWNPQAKQGGELRSLVNKFQVHGPRSSGPRPQPSLQVSANPANISPQAQERLVQTTGVSRPRAPDPLRLRETVLLLSFGRSLVCLRRYSCTAVSLLESLGSFPFSLTSGCQVCISAKEPIPRPAFPCTVGTLPLSRCLFQRRFLVVRNTFLTASSFYPNAGAGSLPAPREKGGQARGFQVRVFLGHLGNHTQGRSSYWLCEEG